MAMLAAKVRRKLDNGARRLREADRCLKRPASKYSFRTAGQVRRPTRRVAAKVLTEPPRVFWRLTPPRVSSQLTSNGIG